MNINDKLTEIEKTIVDIRAELAKSETVTGAWKPKVGEVYWTKSARGVPAACGWKDDSTDKLRFDLGIVCRTKAELEARLARMEVEDKLRELTCGYSFTYGRVNYYLSKYEDGIWEVEGRMCVWVPGVVYFATMESAIFARDTIGKDKLDLLLGA